MDLILGPFADARAPTMSEAEMDSFERLLDVADQDLYAWIVGRNSTPAAFDDDVLGALRKSAMSGGGGVRGG